MRSISKGCQYPVPSNRMTPNMEILPNRLAQSKRRVAGIPLSAPRIRRNANYSRADSVVDFEALPLDAPARPLRRANCASTAWSRTSSASCDSRARTATACTASNSSRVTRSMWLNIRSNCSRNRASASSRTPENAESAPVATRARSSKSRLSKPILHLYLINLSVGYHSLVRNKTIR